MSKKKIIILSSFILIPLFVVYLLATQAYRVIPYIPFKIATCPYGEGLYLGVYHELPHPVFPGQGSDGMLHLVVSNWWGQILKEGDIFKYNVADIQHPCNEVSLASFERSKGGADWQTILPLWEAPIVEVDPQAYIINKKREVLFLHLSPDTRPDTRWPRGQLYKEDEDPEQFIIETIRAYLPFNIVSIKEAIRHDYKRDDGSILRSIDFVVLVEQKPGTTMTDLPPTTPNGMPTTYKWYALDSEYVKKMIWSSELEKVRSTLDHMPMQ